MADSKLPAVKPGIHCPPFQHVVAGSLVYFVLHTSSQNKYDAIKSKHGSLALCKIFKPVMLKEEDPEFSAQHFLVVF